MPYAATTRMPSSSSSTGMIRPNTPILTVCSAGLSFMIDWITNGSSEMCVTPCLATTSQNRLVENFGWSTTVPPTPRTDQMAQLWVLTWKNGSEAR